MHAVNVQTAFVNFIIDLRINCIGKMAILHAISFSFIKPLINFVIKSTFINYM